MAYAFLYQLVDAGGRSMRTPNDFDAHNTPVSVTVSDTVDGTNDRVIAAGQPVIIGGTTYQYAGFTFGVNNDPVVTADGITYFLYTNDGTIPRNTTIADLDNPQNSYTVCFLPGTLIACP